MAANTPITDDEKRAPSVFDVAREAGVSHTTVGLVLKGDPGGRVSLPTRDRVNEAVRKLSYRPNRLAKSLARGRTFTVGMTLPFSNSNFHGEIVLGVQDALRENNYRLIVVHTDDGNGASEEDLVEFFVQQRVEALVCFRPNRTVIVPAWLQTLREVRIPAVMVDDSTYQDIVDCVISDDQHAMDMAIDHLVGLGHRRIALLKLEYSTTPARDRLTGYHHALKQHGLEYALSIETQPQWTDEMVAERLLPLLRSPDAPTALVCMNDYQLKDLLTNKEDYGVKIPDDISIIGYGNTELSCLAKLTTVEQYPRNMGRIAGERILAKIQNPSTPCETLIAPTGLVIRRSTRSIQAERQGLRQGEIL
ncbi:MAG: LacI family DNA-binding transcriptional regulator [Capsulimonadaceae bacterium]|nr:LacI family DNA-binding transcriptional regulator [Capsulimonadaceae bacterium]